MEIKGSNYRVAYAPETATITCQGELELQQAGYSPIIQLFNEVVDQKPETITLQLLELKYLNSSGINALCKLVIKVRSQKTSQMVVRGTRQFPWQTRSLKNLQRWMPGLKLEIE